ncbi:MAG: Nif3-like dinuclear metal center hexameric protein [Caldilineae bacterium]|nr:MAG: Nif3-like dinuclear metal center hexameric protein [Caldilineae bacterium]
MVLLDDLIAFLNDFMGYSDDVPRIDSYLPNGLQVAGAPEIHKIATGVSANRQLFERAVAAGAQAVLVHHGMNPPSSVHFHADRVFTARLKYLWAHNLSLIGYHYLLDRHPQVGHNACIIRALGGEPLEPYGKDGWGWLGEIEGGGDRDALLAKCRDLFQGNGVYYPFGAPTVRRIVSLAGSGAPRPGDYEWLTTHAVDLFITGEPREWNRELCREAGISMVAGGHYNTEIIGLHELSRVIRQHFDVDIEFIDLPNEV